MTKDTIRKILKDQARLSVDVATLSDDADLYQAGGLPPARLDGGRVCG